MTLRVEDRLAILDLAAHVNEAVSRRDVAAHLSYFTTDGALEGDMGTLTGQDARHWFVAQLTSSRPINGDGTPTLTSRVSCFIG